MKVQVKKKLVQNFEFDPKDVKIEKEYEIIESRNILLNQLFTLKRFSLDDPQSQAKYERLLRQISILKQLNANYVVKCHKILKSKSHVYLVYDHCSGKTLNDVIEINQQIIKAEGKIDSASAAKLQENLIDLPMILNIGKQLYQILAQLQQKNLVHMRFYPQNLILQKNGMLKLSNFSHFQLITNHSETIFTEFSESNQFTDPFSKNNNKIGYFTDIYSYGKILKRLYEIHKFSEKFQPNKQLENLIDNLIKQNPQQRAKQKQILDFFIGSKRSSQISKKRSRDQLIQKVSRTKIQNDSKQQLSTCRSLKSLVQRPLTSRTTQQDLGSRGQAYYLRSNNLRDRQTRIKNSETFKTSLSRDKSNSRLSYNSRQIKDQLFQETTKQLNDFSQIKTKILKKRNQSIILLQISNVIAYQIQGQNAYTFQLVYLLYKKSMIELVSLAKYLSKGAPKYISNISQSIRLKFIKTSDYYNFCKVINDQLEEQRNVMTNICSILKKQCNSIMFNGKNSQFEKQLKFQALNGDFFMLTIRKYLESFVQDFMIFNMNAENSQKIFFYLNLMMQLQKSKSYENFIVQNFQRNSIKSEKQTSNSHNKRNYQDLLQNSPFIKKLKQKNVTQLSENLVEYLENGKN